MCTSNSRVYLGFILDYSIGIIKNDFSLTKVKCYLNPSAFVPFIPDVLFIWSEDDILFIAGGQCISVFKVASSTIISQTGISYGLNEITAMQRLDNDYIFVITYDYCGLKLKVLLNYEFEELERY